MENIQMSKKHELKQMLAKVADEIEAMAGKSTDEGFKEAIFEPLKEKFAEINKQLGRVEEAEKIAANLATPVPGQDRLTPFAPPSAHKLYGPMKNFRAREIDGRTVRAIDQAYTAGMWFKATVLDNAEAKDWCKSRGGPIQKAQGEGGGGQHPPHGQKGCGADPHCDRNRPGCSRRDRRLARRRNGLRVRLERG